MREFVDFSHIPPNQAEMHERLLNWARACRSGAGDGSSPMFRLYRSNDHWQRAREASIPVDQHDATTIAKAVQALPEPHMVAVGWFYLTKAEPMAGRRRLGCTAASLLRYVVDGRQMLINRDV